MKTIFLSYCFIPIYFLPPFSLFLFIYFTFSIEKEENNKINIRESGSCRGAIGGAIPTIALHRVLIIKQL